MSFCTITLSANAGVSLDFGGVRIWVDALHRHRVPNFSSVSPELLEKVWASDAFAAPDVIFYTHCHPDHYSRALTEEALARWPGAQLILPEQEFPGQILLTGEEASYRFGGVTMEFRRLCHEKEQYADVPHYGALLSDGEKRILLPGDCAVANPALSDWLGGVCPDAVLLDFPWITLQRGRRFIQDFLPTEHLIVYHLPFPQDDPSGYRAAVQRAAAWLDYLPDVRFLESPLQSITL